MHFLIQNNCMNINTEKKIPWSGSDQVIWFDKVYDKDLCSIDYSTVQNGSILIPCFTNKA